jgi:hypothetical protein
VTTVEPTGPDAEAAEALVEDHTYTMADLRRIDTTGSLAAAAQTRLEAAMADREAPTSIEELTAWLDALAPLRRAKFLAVITDGRNVPTLVALRRAAIYEATRHTSRAAVAAELGVSPQAVGKAITDHLRHARIATGETPEDSGP